MGFIREYAEAGDPFRFRIPRAIRRMTPGRALRGLAHVAAPFAGFIPGGAQAMDFARSFGVAGDPGPRRKQAAAGPKAKAKTKAVHRAQKQLHGAAAAAHAAKGRRPKGKKKGGTFHAPHVDWTALGQGAAHAASAAHDFIHGGHDNAAAFDAAARGAADMAGVPDFGAPIGIAGSHAPRGAHGFGHRRTMNPANVKALRRAGRRVEGFEKLVRRVAPHLLTAHSTQRRARTHKGHKSGCGCFACKKSR